LVALLHAGWARQRSVRWRSIVTSCSGARTGEKGVRACTHSEHLCAGLRVSAKIVPTESLEFSCFLTFENVLCRRALHIDDAWVVMGQNRADRQRTDVK
jgi:hypothetical protein